MELAESSEVVRSYICMLSLGKRGAPQDSEIVEKMARRLNLSAVERVAFHLLSKGELDEYLVRSGIIPLKPEDMAEEITTRNIRDDTKRAIGPPDADNYTLSYLKNKKLKRGQKTRETKN